VALLLFGVSSCLAGCAEPRRASEFFELVPESNAHRAMQTRAFETGDDLELLSASAATLQDLGFQIEESVSDLGLLRAAKERSAREYGQEINRFFLSLLGNQIPVDLQQKISASLIARPLGDAGSRSEVRVTFFRVVWKSDGQRSRGQGQSEYIPPGLQRMEMIRDPLIYQQFFARLSKAVFLEAHKI
jgi:hypothetical protein